MSERKRPLLPTRLELVAAGFLAAASCVICAVLKSSKAIREEMGELMDRVEAITTLATEEKRELTAEEKAEIDGILGSGKKGETGYKPGKIDALEADLLRIEKIENKSAELKNKRLGDGVQPQRSDGPDPEDKPEPSDRIAKVKIPAEHRHRYAKLKHFKGENAEKLAYLAGRFFAASLYQHSASAQWCRDHGIPVEINAVLKEGGNSTGGFVVPSEVEQTIIDLREEFGVFRQNAFVTNMASDTKTQPRRKSGLTAYWVGEGDEVTASDKAWDQVQLVAKKLGALVRYSSELSEDAFLSIGDDLTGEIAYAFASAEDAAGFVGDGTSTYGGHVGVVNAVAAGSVVTAASGNTGFETLDLADFESCVGKLPMYAGIMPKWYISQAGWAAAMLRLLDAAGGNTTSQLMAGAEKMFLGYPVVISQKLNSTLGADASKPKAIFGDLKLGATLGNRRGVSIKLSDQRFLEFDQLGILGTERVALNVHGRGDATNAGPLLVLKTPAS
jgi:HK97 family phage major capsid protein